MSSSSAPRLTLAPRLLCAVLALASALALPAAGADLDTAKAAGQVGEQIDGYLGLVAGDAPAELRALVKQVNVARQAEYARIATGHGIPIEAVAQRAGAKLVERTPTGQFVRDLGGWRRK